VTDNLIQLIVDLASIFALWIPFIAVLILVGARDRRRP